MKNSIKLTALLVLASVSVFAAKPAKAIVPANGGISFSALPSHKGIDIKVQSAPAAKAIVIVSDQDGNVIFKDAMPAYKKMEKGYILNQLDNGDYTIEVIAGHQTVTKDVHVYDEDGAKEFIISE
ncbi:hypothetical protein [Mucilaginibacter sp.]|uniref:hypothetical protein n=1 Tax=Mucilaginibacter sp. TaxID=1882438 RepID=UPI00283C6B26|nr:hypothetical protein [Mucilaginibacter sp.]MDR3695343.1 hypothetical protein [Mucilaginibacter sp.]